MPVSKQELLRYLETLVPYWRVCADEAWPFGDEHLVGFGVLRNYGGEVMVLPWEQETRDQLQRLREKLEPLLKRVIVVVADHESDDIEEIKTLVAPIEVLPWSRRDDLVNFIIKDIPD